MKPDCRHVFPVLLLIALATVLAYSSVGSFNFNSYDDRLYVTRNDLVKGGVTSDGFVTVFTRPVAANWHPLTMLSHMIDVQLFGLNPGAHHLVNLCFHVLNSALLCWILLRMTAQFWPSAAVALLFGVHPLHVESVAWVAQRKDVLSGFFALLTLWAYARYAARQNIARYLLVFVFYGAGLLSKPILVTLPLLLLLLDFWPLARFSFSPESNARFPKQSLRRLLIEKIPLIVLALACSLATFVAQSSFQAVGSLERFPLLVRLANSLVSYTRYLGKAIWPSDLSFLYPHPGLWPWPIVIAATLVLMILTLAAVLHARQRPWLIVGWLWFLISLLPVIGLLQAGEQAMADRYMYLPLIGLAIIVAWAGRAFLVVRPHLKLAVSVAGVLTAIACIVVTRAQAAHWRTSESLYAHALRLDWNNATAHQLMGTALAERGDPVNAIKHYYEALRVRPNYDPLHYDVALSLTAAGALEQATNHLATALRLNPAHTNARYHFARALALLGDTRGAVSNYTALLEGSPQDYDIRIQLGYALLARNDLAPALEHFREALRLAPHSPAAHHALAVGLLQAGKTDDAISHLHDALKLAPAFAPAHRDLGRALARGGDPTGAIAAFREAIRLRPSFAEALNDLAWLLATHPDASIRSGAEASQLATQACELSGYQQPVPLTTLAAAYAELGQFDQAARTAERALAVSGNSTGLQTHKVLEAAKRNGAYRVAPEVQ